MNETILHRVDEYRKHPGINQTWLKELIDPSSKATGDFSEHMGTIVDLRLYTPELFMRDYFVSDEDTSVSDAVKEILRAAYAASNGGTLEEAKPYILADAKQKEYMKNIKTDEGLLNNILVVKNGTKYYQGLLEAKGKIVISSYDFALSTKIMVKMRAAMAEFNTQHEGDLEVQLPVFFEHGGISCKALLDFAILNHTLKRIKPVDTKVSEIPHDRYPTHATKLRYDLQMAFYKIALEWLVKNDERFDGWVVDNPSLLVYSVASETVVEYLLTDADLHVGRWGAETSSTWVFRHPVPLSGVHGSFNRKSKVYGFEDGLEIHRSQNEDASGSRLFQSLNTQTYTTSVAGLWTK